MFGLGFVALALALSSSNLVHAAQPQWAQVCRFSCGNIATVDVSHSVAALTGLVTHVCVPLYPATGIVQSELISLCSLRCWLRLYETERLLLPVYPGSRPSTPYYYSSSYYHCRLDLGSQWSYGGSSCFNWFR